jgi:hypothetical protein
MLGDEKAGAIHLDVVALGEKPGPAALLKGAACPPRRSPREWFVKHPQPSLPDLRQTAAL